jgi:hypothetical protein
MSEFINSDADSSSAPNTSSAVWITNAMAVVGCIFLLCLVVYGANYYGGFLGAMPTRSDLGSSGKFNLQREVDRLLEKQNNNIGSI